MLGDGAAVDAYAGSFGDVLYLGEHLLELKRESAIDGINAGGDDVIGVLERAVVVDLVVVVLVEELERERAGDGFALGLIAGQFDRYHGSYAYNGNRYPRRKRLTTTALLRNLYSCRTSSSSQKLKFPGALLFVIVI